MSFKSLSEIVEKAKTAKKEFWQIIIKDDMKEQGTSFEVSFAKMKDMYLAMKNADKNYDPALRSASGLSGGDGAKLEEFKKQKNVSEEKIVQALFVAAGIGEIIAQNACISGAQGGCQAEIGSSSAMAAGALTSLDGGTNDDILNSVALALKSMLGLTCDPVAGLVEIPCIKRNVSGAVNAVVASQMTKAGVKSAIPADEVIDSMGRIGKLIPACLRETGEDGLAATPTGLTIMQKMRQ